MRLVCPNCGAQYEVPNEVIPTAGRDVQCSNCGDTWFQKHADDVDDGEENANFDWDENGDAHPDNVDDIDPDTLDADQEAAHEQPLGEAIAPPNEADPLRRQQLDPSIAEVLREEADLETAARQFEGANGLESQPDLGLEEPQTVDESGANRRAQEARQRMSRMRGEPDPVARAKGAAGEASGSMVGGSRRDLLPDIEEINSTLRSTKDRRAVGDAQDPASPASVPQKRQRRSFRLGFSVMLLLLAILVLAYVYAPVISTKVPQLDSVMGVYVEKVNLMRLWLDARVWALRVWLDLKAEGGA